MLPKPAVVVFVDEFSSQIYPFQQPKPKLPPPKQAESEISPASG
jgi:hypothetical protein